MRKLQHLTTSYPEPPPSPADLLQLRENGLAPEVVRLRGRGWGGAEAGDDDDEETWEDVITEGEDPWLRNPVALEEDALGFAGLLLGTAEERAGPDPAAAAARAYEAAAAGSVAWGELQRRWAADGSAWAVLDVRKDPEAVPRCVSVGRQETCPMTGVGQGNEHFVVNVHPFQASRPNLFRRPPPGSIWLPLERLDKQVVAGLGCARLAVLATGDLRGQQACVRLRDVFGYSETVLATEWEQ